MALYNSNVIDSRRTDGLQFSSMVQTRGFVMESRFAEGERMSVATMDLPDIDPSADCPRD